MHIIVCVDERGGMLFNKRRQSRDRLLRARILSGLGGRRFLMNDYSFRQFRFDDGKERITVDADFLKHAEAGDVCFVENTDVLPYRDRIETVTVYKWNRRYPSSIRLPSGIIGGRALISTEDFGGSSHDKITEEIYK